MTFLVFCLDVINQNYFNIVIVFLCNLYSKIDFIKAKAHGFNRGPQSFLGGYRVPAAKKC